VSLRYRPPRIFYGWIVAGVASICVFVASGIWYSFQVFFVAFLDHFQTGRGETSLVFSICVIVYSASSVLVGALLDRFGPRWVVSSGGVLMAVALLACSQAQELWHLYIAWGVLVAFGIALADVMPAFVVLSNWFVRHRGTAMGLASAGSGLGLLVFLPLTEVLVSGYQWRNAFVLLAGIAVVVVVPLAALLYRRSPSDMGLPTDGDLIAPGPIRLAGNMARPSRHITLATAIRHPAFWLLAAGFGCAPLSTSAVLTHQVAFMTDTGLPPVSAAFFAGLVGLGGATGRIVIPALSDRIGRVAAYGLSTASLIIGIGSLFLGGHTGALPFFYLYAIAMGCGYGPPRPHLRRRYRRCLFW